jgi:hypothetical protein
VFAEARSADAATKLAEEYKRIIGEIIKEKNGGA